MSLIYAALTLRSAGKPITRDNLNAVLKATGAQADQAEIDALLGLLGRQGAPGPEEQTVRTESPPPNSGEAPDPNRRALYVYAVVAGEGVPFETAGIDGAAVFTMACNGLVAVVHECAAQPYSSQRKEVVEDWVLSHQAVVEEACRHYEAVLPMSFDMLVTGEDCAEATERLCGWLRDEGVALRRKAERVHNREEYGVQVLLDVESATRQATDTCPAIIELRKDLEGKSAGAAYLHKQQLEKLLRQEIQTRAQTVFREAFELASQHSVEVSVDKLTRTDGSVRMVANLSCLVEKGRDEPLKTAFNEHCADNGLAARVTGPWPPYSFV